MNLFSNAANRCLHLTQASLPPYTSSQTNWDNTYKRGSERKLMYVYSIMIPNISKKAWLDLLFRYTIIFASPQPSLCRSSPRRIYLNVISSSLQWLVRYQLKRSSCGRETYPIQGHNMGHDDVMKWNHFPRYWPFVWEIHRSRWIPRTKATDAELWCFLWPVPEWFETPPCPLWRQCNGMAP